MAELQAEKIAVEFKLQMFFFQNMLHAVFTLISSYCIYFTQTNPKRVFQTCAFETTKAVAHQLNELPVRRNLPRDSERV